MTNEDREWFRFCEAMGGGSPEVFMSTTTLDTFFKWREHRHLELSEPTRIELYLAKILHRLFEIPPNVWGKESGVTEDKFVIKFTMDGKPVPESELDADEIQKKVQERADESYNIWAGVLSGIQAKAETIDPNAGFPLQTNFGEADKSRINADLPSPPLPFTEGKKTHQNAITEESEVTDSVYSIPPEVVQPKKPRWTGGPQ